MSLSQNPLTGQMHKSMANFVTTVYRGRNVIRAKVFMPRNVNSNAQQLQRASFKLMVDMYESFGGVTEESFPKRLTIYSPFNAFMKANLPAAIDKSGGIPVIDYSKVIVSSGSLPKVLAKSAAVGATGITVSYATNTKLAKVSESDQVILFALTTAGELIMERQVRGKQPLTDILIPYPGITAAEVECCYLFALSEDGKNASDSTYVEIV